MDWTRRNFWRQGQGDWADPPDSTDKHVDGDVENRAILPSEPSYASAQLPTEDPNGRGILRYVLYLVQKVFLEGASSFVDVHGNTIDAMQSLRDEIKKLATLVDPDDVPISLLTYLARNIGYEFIFQDLILTPSSAVGTPWSVSNSYSVNDVVTYGGDTYISINETSNVGKIPDVSPMYWSSYNALSSEKTRRNEVKWATQWYKLKGVPRGYEVLFEAIGKTVNIFYVWSNRNNRLDTRVMHYGDVPSENKYESSPGHWEDKPVDQWVYYPDSIIRIVPELSYFIGLVPKAFNDILKRIDEVIPAHLLYEFVMAISFTGECPQDTSICGDVLPISDDIFPYLHYWADLNGINPSKFLDKFNWNPANCLTHGSTCFPPPRHDGIAIASHGNAFGALWDDIEDAPFSHKYDSSYPYRGWCEFHDNPLSTPSWVYLDTYKGDDFSSGIIDPGWDSEFTGKYALDIRPPLSGDYCATLVNPVDHGVWWRVFSNIDGDTQVDFSIKMSGVHNSTTQNLLLRLISFLGDPFGGVMLGVFGAPVLNQWIYWITPSNILTFSFHWTPYQEIQLRLKRVSGLVTGYYNVGVGWFSFPDSYGIAGQLNIDSNGYFPFGQNYYSFSKFEFQSSYGLPNIAGDSVLHNNDCQNDKLWIYDHNDHSVPIYESTGYPY